MTSANDNKKPDSGFSSFALGVSVGVVAALLFGTDEGRKIVKKVLDNLPEKYHKIPQSVEAILPKNKINDETITTPVMTPFETPHHATYDFETPPPPPPSVNLTRPS